MYGVAEREVAAAVADCGRCNEATEVTGLAWCNLHGNLCASCRAEAGCAEHEYADGSIEP